MAKQSVLNTTLVEKLILSQGKIGIFFLLHKKHKQLPRFSLFVETRAYKALGTCKLTENEHATTAANNYKVVCTCDRTF